jgi:ER-bound oxygenase mpaB/B'/Rubber oxygenase, catalytic domain
MIRLRACCVTHGPCGLAVTPPMWTRLLSISMKKGDVEALQPDGLDGEEIAGNDPGRLPMEKVGPAEAGAPRCRLDAVASKHSPNCARRNREAEPAQLTLDPPVALGRVLGGYPQDQLAQLRSDAGAAGRATLLVNPAPANSSRCQRSSVVGWTRNERQPRRGRTRQTRRAARDRICGASDERPRAEERGADGEARESRSPSTARSEGRAPAARAGDETPSRETTTPRMRPPDRWRPSLRPPTDTRRTRGRTAAAPGTPRSFRHPQEAEASAAGVRAVHAHVQGTTSERLGRFPAGAPYAASDPALLLWVHATLVETSLAAYARFVGPLAPDEEERCYREMALVARLFETPAAVIPARLTDFREYLCAQLSGPHLRVTDPAREVAAVLEPRLPPPFAASDRSTGSRRPPSCRHGSVTSPGSAGAGLTQPPLPSPPARCAWLRAPLFWRRRAPRRPRPTTRPELRPPRTAARPGPLGWVRRP